MKSLWAIVCLVAVLGLAACQGAFKPDPTARAFYDAIHAGDISKVRAMAAPEFFTPGAEQQLALMRSYMPKEAPTAVKFLGRHDATMLNAGETANTQDVYEFNDRKAVVSARLQRATSAQPWRVQGFHIRVVSPAEMKANAFTFEGKSFAHFAFLLATVAAPLLMVAALVKVVRRKGLRRKWLWGILAFVGLCTFRMDWTTGAVAANPLTVQFIGAGIVTAASGLAPWVLSFTAPVGALLILTGVWANPARARVAKVKTSPEAFD
jgi:hypothetical protein